MPDPENPLDFLTKFIDASKTNESVAVPDSREKIPFGGISGLSAPSALNALTRVLLGNGIGRSCDRFFGDERRDRMSAGYALCAGLVCRGSVWPWYVPTEWYT